MTKRNLSYSESTSRKIALITGATSGIGYSYARKFASQDYDLIITGRRKILLSRIADQLQNHFGINVETVIADLTIKDDLYRLLKVLGRRKQIDILVNNAGYGLNCAFSEDMLARQMEMIKVHVEAPLLLIHKVLPGMMNRKSGVIINVSSLAAFMPTSISGMYSGTKSFIRSFTESLHMDVAGYGIKVQCLCPGFTVTDFHRNSYLKEVRPFYWMTPDQVVEHSLNSLKKGQIVCIPGFFYRAVCRLTTLMPRKMYYPIARRLEKSFNTGQKIKPALYF